MRRLLFALTIVLLLQLLTSPAFAILNIEALRQKLAESESVGVIGLSFDRKEGNTDTLKWLAQGQALARKGDTEYLLAFEREFGSTASVYDVNRRMEHGRVTWPAEDRASVEVYVQEEQNQFLRLSSRLVAGSGLRYRWVDEKTLRVYTGAGAFWSSETLTSAPNTTDAGTENLLRASVYASFVAPLTPQATLASVLYYQPSVTSFADTRILNSSQVSLQITQRLGVTLAYNLAYDSRPPQNVKMADQEYATIFNLKF